jgi:hypothetical protein
VTAAPPWTLWVLPVVAVSLPQPPAIAITVPPALAAITVAWPRVRAAQDRPPPAPRVIRLAAPPQRPWRLPFPNGHPLRTTALPPRRR